MAWPKGITRAKLNEMKEAGTAEAWMSEHAKQSEAGTLDAWLAGQDLKPSGAPVGASSTVKAAPKLHKASPLERLQGAAMGFHQVLSNSPLAAGDFELSDLEALMSTLASLTGVQLIVRDAIGHLEPIMGRLQREAEQAERIGELESTNAALEARVAEMEAALKANGHSDKVAKKQKAMAD